MKIHNKMTLSVLLATGFGVGFLPKAPGTWGSIFGALIAIIFLQNFFLPKSILIFGMIILFLFGIWICQMANNFFPKEDDGRIIFDEIFAIILIIICLPLQNIFFWLTAVIIFRIFDIFKPHPIRFFDEKIRGGLGIMLDDIMAALYSLMVIWALYFLNICL